MSNSQILFLAFPNFYPSLYPGNNALRCQAPPHPPPGSVVPLPATGSWLLCDNIRSSSQCVWGIPSCPLLPKSELLSSTCSLRAIILEVVLSPLPGSLHLSLHLCPVSSSVAEALCVFTWECLGRKYKHSAPTTTETTGG